MISMVAKELPVSHYELVTVDYQSRRVARSSMSTRSLVSPS